MNCAADSTNKDSLAHVRKPLVIAHGNWEKTGHDALHAVARDLSIGADAVEVDVRATKDGVLVALHDDQVRLTDGRAVEIKDCTSADLSRFRSEGLLPASGVVPTEPGEIEDILAFVKDRGRIFAADFKDDECVLPFLDAVRDQGMQDSVIVTGCEDERAQAVVEADRGIQVLLNEDVYKRGISYPYPAEWFGQLFERVRRSGCGGVNMNYQYCSPQFAEYFSKRLVPVSVWTVDSLAEMKKFVELGINSICTNRVPDLVNYIWGGDK